MNREHFNLAIVGTCGIPARYGGFETLAEALVDCLATPSFKILIYAEKGYTSFANSSARQLAIPLKANGISAIIYDIVSLFHASCHSSCILLLGVPGALSLPFLRLLFPSVKYIVHIDGLEWARPKWGLLPSLFLRISERAGVHFSDAFIVDNLGIADYVARYYGKRYLRRASLLTYGSKILNDSELPIIGDIRLF